MQSSWLYICCCFLQMPTLLSTIEIPSCIPKTKTLLYHDGSMVISAFFPIFYFYPQSETEWKTSFDTGNMFSMDERNYQLVLAMLFAIHEINWNSYILPNTSLGLEIYNLLHFERNILRNVFHWLTGLSMSIPNYNCRKERDSAAVLTGISRKTSELIATVLDLYKFPQITFGPFDHVLTDRNQFPSLYQVAPNDISVFYGIASLMLHFNWTWVGLFTTDDHGGAQFLSDLKKELDENRICIAFVETVSFVGESVYNILNDNQELNLQSSANVIIIYGEIAFILTVIESRHRKHILKKVWVMNSKWSGQKFEVYEMLDLSHGTLTFSPHHEEIFGFTNFIQQATPIKYPEDICLHILWKRYFNCSLLHSNCKIFDNCLPNASLELLPGNIFEMGMTEESYNVYNAVYAVAHSLHDMILNQVQFHPQSKKDRIMLLPWQLHPFLKNIQVKNSVDDHVVLDWKRKTDPEYDINNLWNFPTGLSLFVKVGTFSPRAPKRQQLSISEFMIEWPIAFTEIPQSVCSESCTPGFRKVILESKPACCFDCTPCPENEISNETGMDQCFKCPETHYTSAEKKHCLKKTVTFLAYDDPLGKGLTFVSLGFSALTIFVIGTFVNHRDTPIVKANNRTLSYILLVTLTLCFLCPLLFIGLPNTATCILQQNVFGILFTVALSTVLAKTTTVVIAFKITAPGRKERWLLISQAPNFIIPVCTLIQVLLSGIWLGTSPPFVDMDAHSEHGYIIILCNKGSTFAFYCTLAYLGVMAFGSYLMAFLSRNLPDTFNEAKFLSFSMLVFCCVWVTFLPVYHSTTGKFMVAMEVFSILASSASILSLIFAPKCYIILFRPERNTFHFIRDKRQNRCKNLIKT
ncbi:vomeronasal 2 receptor, 76 precursor [Rattus norvegicus]|uniref:Vomeronasal 2 receptor, 76 n=1 Tax=Rattus norvegicus TaxID=10116 RepID=M0R5S6_RAT|nr:vomeronasal 2 receptor, 76 precursor [Rattus norvegicus]|eukprot:NP_001092975.1 vomeronasal 2 receptor, 76 precursor [Rattus norvegicus]